MKWFKFYGQDYLSDPKMLSLSACRRSCWITLLAYASVNEDGIIKHLDENQLMMQAGVSPMHDEWGSTQGVLKILEDLGMITNDNGVITVLNWEKRQETNLTSYERLKRHRQKKRDDNAMITLEENRIDKNRIEDILPEWVNYEVWKNWEEYRKDKRQKLTPRSVSLQLKFLEKDITNHVAIIEQSIQNGWTGLFPLKGDNVTKPVRVLNFNKK